MNSKTKIEILFALSSILSSRLIAGIDLPFETIREMAVVNPVNGDCSFGQVKVTEQGGVRSLSMTLKIGDRSIPATISQKESQTQWSESKGTDGDRSPFWIFILKDGDGSTAGAITEMDWQVKGPELLTESLSLQYVDPTSGSPVAVTCK